MSKSPEERHDREQRFFDGATLAHLADFVAGYENPCLLCCPMVAKTLAQRGVAVALLDTDERFADAPGYRRWDLTRPEWLGEAFDLILCDPPFFAVSLSQLNRALRLLARHDDNQPLLVCHLVRRETALLRALRGFALTPTGYQPGYATVDPSPRNRIQFYGNLGEAAHQRLATPTPT